MEKSWTATQNGIDVARALGLPSSTDSSDKPGVGSVQNVLPLHERNNYYYYLIQAISEDLGKDQIDCAIKMLKVAIWGQQNPSP